VTPDASVVVISYNTRDLLRECLRSLGTECEGIDCDIFVVDNNSRDGSADMVEGEFPLVHLIRSHENLGFAGANNRALPLTRGRYVVLLNSDAFFQPGALATSIRHMDAEREVGLGGARLIGRDGSWQPSARLFPSVLNDFLTITGLSTRFPRSRFFGRFDRTWADQNQPADTDWVPGAFSIIRREVFDRLGYFDEAFFLYYEEVDLCRRIRAAGYTIRYWPDVVVVHWGGESSRTVQSLKMSSSGSQLALWRMRAAFLYFRKHHGSTAWVAKQMERIWHQLRAWKNGANDKGEESRALISLLDRAWAETRGGFISPNRPW
jgi:hypothetical protein